jgi:TolB protein
MRTREGSLELHVMNADGSRERRLTHDAVSLVPALSPALSRNLSPSWSPDGRKVVFSTPRDGNWDVLVVNADGSGQRRLTRDPARDGLPAWSPDGRLIAFVRDRNGNDRVYVMNADGSGQRMLARRGGSFAWSPNGRKIAFLGCPRGIGVINADGSGQVALTPRPPASRCANLVWSPDGRKIAFAGASGSGGNCGEFCFAVWVVDADGSAPQNLTRKQGARVPGPVAFEPVWSPDGRKIAFVSDRDGSLGVYVMNSDGSVQRRLASLASDPAWSPDGQKLVFASQRDGAAGLYVVNADGSRRRTLTRSPASANSQSGRAKA